MNRNEEYAQLLSELEDTPAALDHTVSKARARVRTVHRKRRLFGIPAGSLAACFLTFMLLVNLFPPFAYACGSLPLLRNLAKAVAWSPSLSAAVDNAYVQPMGLEQTQDGVTVRIEYIIVDQKQLNVYYTLHSKQYPQLEANADAWEIGGEEKEFGLSYGSFGTPNGELRDLRMDCINTEMPGKLRLMLQIYAGKTEESGPPEASVEDDMLESFEYPQPAYLSEFTFDLAFDPTFTARGELLEINQSFHLEDQTITLTNAELYPTHLRLNFTGGPENTAWLEGLDFYVENERGERFHPVTNGITATGDPESPAMKSYWLDSPYFSHSQRLTLHITRAEWLNKDAGQVYLNLETGQHGPMPEGVALVQATEKRNGWLLAFSGREFEENHMYSLWGSTYYDSDGKAYSYNTTSSTISYYDEETGTSLEEDGVFYEEFALRNYPETEVWLEPLFTHFMDFDQPISVPIK